MYQCLIQYGLTLPFINYYHILGGKGPGSSGEWIAFINPNGGLGISFFENNTSTRIDYISGDGIVTTAGGWYHIVFTYDGLGLNNSCHIYVNGNEISYSVSGTEISGTSDTSYPFRVGRKSDDSFELHSYVSQIAFFNEALSAGAVSALYNSHDGSPYSDWPETCAGNNTIERTWTATDECGNSASEIQTIYVTDTEAPVITLPADITVECGDDITPTGTGSATATDNCDSDPTVTFSDATTPGSCAGNYIIERTWTAEDECGNISTAIQTISVEDNTPPTISFNNPIIYLRNNGTFVLTQKDICCYLRYNRQLF